jgi:uncharacterized protein with FMN-binding domain
VRRGTRQLMTVATTAVVAVAFGASVRTHSAGVGPAAVSSEQPRHTSTAQSSRSGSRTVPTTSPSTQPATSPSTRPSVSPSPRSSSPPAPQRSTATPKSSSVVAAGGVVDTQYGPVQVEVTVRGGRIVKAHTLQHPSGDGQTDQINGYAVPQLNQEALAAQSAQIDTVSGATFTSEGYRQSLQSALDAAHRAGAR